MIGVSRSLLMFMVGIGAASPFLSAAPPAKNAGAVFVMTNDASKNEVIAYESEPAFHWKQSNRTTHLTPAVIRFQASQSPKTEH